MDSQANNSNRHSPRQVQKFIQRLLVITVASGLTAMIAIAVWQYQSIRNVNELGLREAQSYGQMLEMARLEDGYCILKFKAPYCFPCSFSEPDDVEGDFHTLADRYVMYELNALDLTGEGADLVHHYLVTKLPTWLVLNSDGEEVKRWEQPEPPLVAELKRLEAMRELAGPASQQHFSQNARNKYALQHLGELTYWEAITYAEEIEPVVLESVWIQPEENGRWAVCSGVYDTAEAAETSKAFHEGWEGRPVEITSLLVDGWNLPEQQP